jgi:serine/threonine protein kinase
MDKEKKRRDKARSTMETLDDVTPEVLLKQSYTHKVDHRSFGAIMNEILFGSLLFLADTTRGTALKMAGNLPVSGNVAGVG